MKRSWKLVPMLLLLVFGAVVSSPVMAQYRGHGGYSHGGGHVRGHGGGVGLGLALGAALVGMAYYARPAYSYPAYAYPAPAYAYPGPAYAYPGPAAAPSATHIEQGVPQAAPAQPQADWYYCADSKSYYPYVRECPAGWQRVPSTPPR
jgi:hypothetical protein